jgi:transcriptional regulator with GAF, ATPase, and Fis domain
MTTKKRFLIWNKNGDLLVDHSVELGQVVFGNEDDADVTVDGLASCSFVLEIEHSAAKLLILQHGAKPVEVILRENFLLKHGDFFVWLHPVLEEGQVRGSSKLHHALLEMITSLSSASLDKSAFRQALQQCLDRLVGHTAAQNGMLVLAQPLGFDLIAVSGIATKEAQRLWEKMPDNLTKDILRDQARVILPDSFRDKKSDQTTIYLTGIKSTAGFPLVVDQQVVAIIYLNFRSLIAELSPQLQNELVFLLDILALAVHRAMLLENLESIEQLGIRKTGDAGTIEQPLMIGSSSGIRRVYALLRRVAPTDVSVLVRGETGTGKELAAMEIHRLSSRSKKEFVAINAAALPENLLESELFGHVRGAFTGAISDKKGLIDKADGGTLFIDEIGDLPLTLQAKLLRVLQEKTFAPVGSSKTRSVDFRLVCATHRDLKQMINQNLFREDLYFRLATVEITLPALRERSEDIPLLVNYFKERFIAKHRLPDKNFSDKAMRVLQKRHWPGNIRQLINVISNILIMADNSVIAESDLSPILGMEQETSDSSDRVAPLNEAKDKWLKTYIADALDMNLGNRVRTAKMLGIGERTLFRYIEQLGIS